MYPDVMLNYPLRNLRRIAVLTALAVIVSSCAVDPDGATPFTFDYQGLEGTTPTRFYPLGDGLLAATDDGIYVKSAGEHTWRRAGLEGLEVLDVAVFSGDHFLAACQVLDESVGLHGVRWRTTNGGQDWVIVEDGFGAGDPREVMRGMHYDAASGRLFATSTTAVGLSLDHGRTWELLWGNYGGFGVPMAIVRLNPATQELWYGGQGPIENGFLVQHVLSTGERSIYSTLMPNPHVYYGIRFDPTRPNVVYAAGEGGVVFTTDRGTTWRNLLGDKDYRFYFDIAIDPADRAHLYTAGWTKLFDEPQPLILEWSRDGGSMWQTHEYPASANFFGGVRSMILVDEAGKKSWYLGLHRGGIMRVRVVG
jgi:photosystem II stability/assembly factor-like uncharacterized protein